jgi:cytochrome bd-type quinol oxidase subunit 2
MLQRLRKKIAVIAATLALAVVPMAVPVVAHAASGDDIQSCLAQGSSLQISSGSNCSGGNTSGGTKKVNQLITDAVNIFSAIVGVISVIMIIFGGFKYITSGGDSNNVSSAKNTIIYAVIGLVVVAMAQFIVQFVLNKVTSGSGA